MVHFKLYRYVYLGILAVGMLICGHLSAANLHVILVGDTAAQDLKSSVLQDLKHMEQHLIEVAKYTGLDPLIHRITDRSAKATLVLDELRDIKTVQEDVVLFYFSGHGYRTPEKENPWPNLYFATDQTGVDLLEVSEILETQRAHLVITFADCCNSTLPSNFAPPVIRGQASSKLSDEKIKQNYKKLFIDTQGSILIASSKAGQPSWTISGSGSMYTDAYIETFNSLVKRTKQSILDWGLVLDQAKVKTYQTATKNGVSQDPIYND